MDFSERSLAGFDVWGRNGTLGVVVAQSGSSRHSDFAELVVSGGRSSLLRLHIPMSQIADVSFDARSISVHLDIVDFSARVSDDGLVDLRLI